MKNRFRCSSSIVALIAAAGLAAASAATRAEAQSAVSWEGPYIGAHIGFAEQDVDGIFQGNTSDAADELVDLGLLDLNGATFGGHVGFVSDRGNYVLGIEADLSWTGESDDVMAPSSSDNASGEIDLLASIRGRIGVPLGENRDVLAYGTAGLAIRDAEVTVCTSTCDVTLNVETFGFSDLGPVFGAGVEWAATDRVRLRVEGLYYGFSIFDDNDKSISVGDTGDSVDVGDAWTIRAGISFYF